MKPYYQDDYVTLFHGDCLEVTEWTTADVLVTDPPYGIAYDGIWNYVQGEKNKTKPIKKLIQNDAEVSTRDAALELWGKKPWIVFGSWRIPRPVNTENRLIWHKAGMAPGPSLNAFMSQDEEIYISGKGFRKTSPPLRSVIRTEESRSREVSKIGHPTPKPVGLMEVLIDRCPDGVVADPFAGSGATLIAARNLSRHAIGVELDEEYCELIAKRLSQQAFDLEGLTA
jgi:site-specific DNA-methyltransferase (adenine-specific)